MSLALLDAGDGNPHQAIGLRGKLVLGAAANAVAVAPGAGAIYTDPVSDEPVPVAIYVGVEGSVTVVPYGKKGAASVTFAAVAAGSMLPIAVIAVTAAANGGIVAVW